MKHVILFAVVVVCAAACSDDLLNPIRVREPAPGPVSARDDDNVAPAPPPPSFPVDLTGTGSTERDPIGLEIVTPVLPTVVAGDAYAMTLEATGGVQPYAWSWSTESDAGDD